MSFRTKLEDVMKLLFSKNMWNLTPPKLIISVTGGATLNLKPRLKDSFRKGLVKAASTTSTSPKASFNSVHRFIIFLFTRFRRLGQLGWNE